MAYEPHVKEKALELRKKGYSVKEISAKLNIAKSTSSLWLRDVSISDEARDILQKKRILGQYKSSLIAKEKRRKRTLVDRKKALDYVRSLETARSSYKLLCSLLYWAEGNKDQKGLIFVNSDPVMISTYLYLLRASFDIKEDKLRALVHIHEYHNEKEIKKFWAEKTRIPLSQFNKSYKKPNTGKRKRQGYKGSIKISYHDVRIAREMSSVYNMFAKNLGA